jgi:glucose-1-phosphate adenylyltransferase
MERSRIGRGAQVRRAIVDQDNDVPPGERIGHDPERDRRRFPVTDSGIVVVPAGYFPPRDTASSPYLSTGGASRAGQPPLEVLA